ncbi:MAG: serine hydrolase [Candidatus Pacebacteria bacterium]|nr:serine hydrolase [Candidatus Paceibacterota bacterium]
MPKIADIAQRAIEEEVFPGCVIGVVRASGEREVYPYGSLWYASDQKVREDTLYDLASVTKSIPVASLAALLLEEGKLRLDDRVTRFVPELHNDHASTIEDLLRYRVRGPRMAELAKQYRTFEQLRTHILEQGFDGPAATPEYSNVPAFILGLVLERAGGTILPALAHRYLFGPLQMNDTSFFSALMVNDPRIAPTEIVEGQELLGIVHDESARMFALRRRAVGHAGVFSTAPDLLSFTHALLDGRFPAIVHLAQEGLGWQREGDLFGSNATQNAFGKTGFTGTSVVIDTQKGMGLVILSNRTYPHRPADSSAINGFRAAIADEVFSS